MRRNHDVAIELRQLLLASFPDIPFQGAVTHLDAEPFPCELFEGCNIYDEEEDLYRSLRGQCWTEIPDEVIARNPDGYQLMTAEAVAALLPSWLIRSGANLGGENEIREFLIYSFSHFTSWKVFNWMQRLNPQQRSTLRRFLATFVEYESSSFLKQHTELILPFFDDMHRRVLNAESGEAVP